MELRTFILSGSPGSGKGTQAKLLAEFLAAHDPSRAVLAFGTGDKFRELFSGTTYTEALAKKVMDTGGLLPEFLPIWMWSSVFIERLTGDEHVIGEGFPRRIRESEVLDTALAFYGRATPDVINLAFTETQALRRLELRQEREGRSDDSRASVEKRFEFYHTHTVPAINFFRAKQGYRFHDINADQAIEEVHEDILRATGLAA